MLKILVYILAKRNKIAPKVIARATNMYFAVVASHQCILLMSLPKENRTNLSEVDIGSVYS